MGFRPWHLSVWSKFVFLAGFTRSCTPQIWYRYPKNMTLTRVWPMEVIVTRKLVVFFFALGRGCKTTYLHPWKINMEPKNGDFEADSPFQRGDFQVPCSFSGVYIYIIYTGYNNPLYLLSIPWMDIPGKQTKKSATRIPGCACLSPTRRMFGVKESHCWSFILDVPCRRSRDRGVAEFPSPVVQVSRGWQNPWQFQYVIKSGGHFLGNLSETPPDAFFCFCLRKFFFLWMQKKPF